MTDADVERELPAAIRLFPPEGYIMPEAGRLILWCAPNFPRASGVTQISGCCDVREFRFPRQLACRRGIFGGPLLSWNGVRPEEDGIIGQDGQKSVLRSL